MDAVAAEARAIRTATGWLGSDHLAVIEVRGDGAHAALDRVLAGDLFLYDAQARQTIILDDEGSAVADVTVAKVEDRWWCFADGLGAEELRRLVEEVASPAVQVRDLLEEVQVIS